MDATEWFFIGDVIHKNEAHSSTIVSRCYCPISFLPCCVLKLTFGIRIIVKIPHPVLFIILTKSLHQSKNWFVRDQIHNLWTVYWIQLRDMNKVKMYNLLNRLSKRGMKVEFVGWFVKNLSQWRVKENVKKYTSTTLDLWYLTAVQMVISVAMISSIARRIMERGMLMEFSWLFLNSSPSPDTLYQTALVLYKKDHIDMSIYVFVQSCLLL